MILILKLQIALKHIALVSFEVVVCEKEDYLDALLKMRFCVYFITDLT